MSGVVEEEVKVEEKAVAVEEKPKEVSVVVEKKVEIRPIVPDEVIRIVIPTDTVKTVFKERYGRDVEKVEYDYSAEVWTISFKKSVPESKEPKK